MNEADEAVNAIREMVARNTSEEGIDDVNAYASLIEALKTDPSITIETWELMKMSIHNGAAIACNLIDEEIVRLREEQHA